MMAGYVLYGKPGFGSAVVEAACAEAGVDYAFVATEKGAGGVYGAEFLALNPRGQVPVLVLPDGSAMTETAAMLLHLADAFPAAGLAPVPGSAARAQHDRWLTFIHANIYEAILRLNYPDRYVSDPAAAPAVREAAITSAQWHFELFEGALGAGPYLFGARLSMVDLYAWMLAGWVAQAPLAAACPKVMRLCAAVAGRPALAGVIARNAD